MFLKRFRVVIAIAVSVMLILGTASVASAYNWPSPYLKWYTTTVYYDTSALPAAWRTEVNSSASTWTAAPPTFTFSPSFSSSNDWTQQNFGQVSPLALTGIYGPGNPADQITQCLTAFNTYNTFTIGGDNDVQTIALHEFGHWLSLDHQGSDPWTWLWDHNKVMYPAYTGIKRALHADDSSGIDAIY
jgi:hypothetical protein